MGETPQTPWPDHFPPPFTIHDARQYSESRRRVISHASREASSLDIGEFHDVDAFHDLVTRFLERRHGATPVHSPEELKLLIGRFPEHIKMFVARQVDELLAVEMIFESPTCYRPQYKASTEEGSALAAAALIEDFLIKGYGEPGQ